MAFFTATPIKKHEELTWDYECAAQPTAVLARSACSRVRRVAVRCCRYQGVAPPWYAESAPDGLACVDALGAPRPAVPAQRPHARARTASVSPAVPAVHTAPSLARARAGDRSQACGTAAPAGSAVVDAHIVQAADVGDKWGAGADARPRNSPAFDAHKADVQSVDAGEHGMEAMDPPIHSPERPNDDIIILSSDSESE